MKLIQFIDKQDTSNKLRVGAVVGEAYCVELQTAGSMRDFIRRIGSSEDERRNVEKLLYAAEKTYDMDQIKLLSPLSDPEKFICIGLNYHDHARESNMAVPKVPILFPKFNNCIIANEEEVVIPQEVKQCDYEVELAFIVGKTAKNISEHEAADYIFGYTIVNDVSARDIQLGEGQWTRGKTIDTFAPVGPWIVTADEIADPQNLNVSLTLNGEVMQSSNTKELIFKIPFLLSFLSKTITLQPGDIISTGTPHGVGMGRNPQVWLKEGDVTEASVDGIGTLRNVFVAGN
ncbi:2-keto-4-pentenoate hydratase/2-oxohepta-3-ene-1,7-dioic acid hydratase in catechol pathway [Paenibacillus castaneae]|uniref:fumarylacetoacetate hydrolase family protein n=1 Tax=Paenibacillus castaneae TaxID=474957 RepID=UPI000C9ADC6B|nr:fumarylacetoacetate hydrolase family protein [Paenibacillus castaneae]NIK78699.1 2-keto-4-pentenoate hydratase/2-oxohepta-3-ene-1,7-dioic acid hydratase in catechol pathway [Paenibacillus castaneae]